MYDGTFSQEMLDITSLPFAEEAWRHIPVVFINFLGWPSDGVIWCTCKGLHRWKYCRFDPDSPVTGSPSSAATSPWQPAAGEPERAAASHDVDMQEERTTAAREVTQQPIATETWLQIRSRTPAL